MEISFIIPAYNEEGYVNDCLNSVSDQKQLKDFEVIVVDNDSTDRTAETVVENFPEARIVHETKKGPAYARNAGAQLAAGELLAFIDADCRLPKGWYRKVSKIFSQNPDLLLLYGPYKYYEDKTRLQRLAAYVGNVLAVRIAKFIFWDLLRLGAPGFGGNTVIKKTAFEKLEGFGLQYEFYGEDIDLTSRALKLGLVKFAPKIWVYSSKRRLHKAGVLKMWWKYSINFLWAVLFQKAWHKSDEAVR